MAGGLKRLAERDNEVAQEAMAFTLTKALDLDALASELAEAFRHPPGLVVHGDPTEASEENPVVLWALGDVEMNQLKRMVTKHKPGEPKTAERPSFLEKLDSNEPFTDEEIQQALRHLLRRGSA